jgi:hypothetical protein
MNILRVQQLPYSTPLFQPVAPMSPQRQTAHGISKLCITSSQGQTWGSIACFCCPALGEMLPPFLDEWLATLVVVVIIIFMVSRVPRPVQFSTQQTAPASCRETKSWLVTDHADAPLPCWPIPEPPDIRRHHSWRTKGLAVLKHEA